MRVSTNVNQHQRESTSTRININTSQHQRESASTRVNINANQHPIHDGSEPDEQRHPDAAIAQLGLVPACGIACAGGALWRDQALATGAPDLMQMLSARAGACR